MIFNCRKCDFCEEAVAHEFGECLPNEDAETHTKTCATCGFAKTEDCNMQLSFKNHTCTEDGWVGHLECTVCGRNKDKREITPAAHTYTNKLKDNGDGTHSRICDVCGEVEDVKTPCTYKPHDLGNGTHEEVCVCGHKKAEPAKHTYGTEYKQSEDGTQHYQVCTLCGAESEKEAHTEKATEGNADGHKVICEVCGETLKENVAHEYKYKENSGNGEEGNHTHVCDCGYELPIEEATKDVWGDLVKKDIPHTQTERGGEKATRTCNVCEYAYSWWFRREKEIVHTYGEFKGNEVVGNEKPTHTKTCTVCGDTVTEDCNMITSFKEHTCTEDGWIGYQDCDVCWRNIEKRVESPARHDYTKNQLKDNENGTHSKVCDKCGDTSAVEECVYVTTDLGDGKHVGICKCGARDGEPVEHTYDGYIDDKNGKHHQVCTECNYKTAQADHTNLEYTEINNEGHKVTCKDCGYIVSENEKHTYSNKRRKNRRIL